MTQFLAFISQVTLIPRVNVLARPTWARLVLMTDNCKLQRYQQALRCTDTMEKHIYN